MSVGMFDSWCSSTGGVGMSEVHGVFSMYTYVHICHRKSKGISKSQRA
jgi:hypothetical protein